MKNLSKLKFCLFYLASALTCLLFAVNSYYSMLEWWKVGVQKKINNYVFNGMPWYYDSPRLYAKVMLIEGLLMLACLAISAYFIINKKNAVYFMLLAGLIYSFLVVVYGQAV